MSVPLAVVARAMSVPMAAQYTPHSYIDARTLLRRRSIAEAGLPVVRSVPATPRPGALGFAVRW
eukprot:2233084-Rhodomonas_salina.6